MKRAATTIAVLAAAGALLAGCGGDSSPGGDPAGGAGEAACTAEITRQLKDPSQTTQDTPPQCAGIADERLAQLANAAVEEIVKNARPSPASSPQ